MTAAVVVDVLNSPVSPGPDVSILVIAAKKPGFLRRAWNWITGKTSKKGVTGNTGRGKNKLGPDSEAGGPHSTYKTDSEGNITNTAEYTPNPKNPTGFDETKRVDVTGRPHTNPDGTVVPTPHVKESGKKGVRPARPEELPKKPKKNP